MTPSKILNTLYEEKTSLYFNTVMLLTKQFSKQLKKHMTILETNDEIY